MSCGNQIIYGLNKVLNIRILFFIICLGFSTTIILTELLIIKYEQHVNLLASEALYNVANDFRYAETYRKLDKQYNNMKYILIWHYYNNEFRNILPEGPRALISRNCTVFNCYFTTNSNFFPDGLQKFDAIAFNGHMLPNYLIGSILNPFKLPEKRWSHQKYIFMSMEPPIKFPVCSKFYDGYFNMTATFKLDSDSPYTYMVIKNSSGHIVGPKKIMKWMDYDFNEQDNTVKYLQKKRTAAWFVSNCKDDSDRKMFADKLDRALNKYGYSVDVYGKCGKLSCPRSNEAKCFRLIDQEYYFYLSLENSFVEDYVTEKLLTAIHNNVIPIVYGGADYSRFLPPHSYLDGRKSSPEEIAELMVELMLNPIKYREYFWWKKFYTYHTQSNENLCEFCARLNDEDFMRKETVYEDFRKWWDPHFESYCPTC